MTGGTYNDFMTVGGGGGYQSLFYLEVTKTGCNFYRPLSVCQACVLKQPQHVLCPPLPSALLKPFLSPPPPPPHTLFFVDVKLHFPPLSVLYPPLPVINDRSLMQCNGDPQTKCSLTISQISRVRSCLILKYWPTDYNNDRTLVVGPQWCKTSFKKSPCPVSLFYLFAVSVYMLKKSHVTIVRNLHQYFEHFKIQGLTSLSKRKD